MQRRSCNVVGSKAMAPTRPAEHAYPITCNSPIRAKSTGTVETATTLSSSLGSASRSSSSSYEPPPESLAPQTTRTFNGKSPSPNKIKNSGIGAAADAFASPSPTSPAPNLLLVKILAKEVAATLIKEGMRRDRADPLKYSSHSFDSTEDRCRYPSLESLSNDEETGKDASEEDGLVDIQRFASGAIDMESVVEMVMENVKKEQLKTSPGRHRHAENNPDRKLRNLLRAHLNDDLLEEELPPNASSKSGSMKTSGSGSSSNKSHARSRSNHSAASKISDVSFGSGGGANKQVQMDIWHPDFWSVDVEGSSPNSTKSPHSASRMAGTSALSDRDMADDNQADDEPSFQGNEDLEDAIDDCSIISDISGLTDAWNLDKASSLSPSKKRGQNHRETSAAKSVIKPLLSSPLRTPRHKIFPVSPGTALHEASTSLIGSHVSATSPTDARSVSSRRSKSSLSSGGSNIMPGASRSSIRTKGSAASSSRQQRSASGGGVPLKSVTFSTVRVRHYERILCDNPAASSGLSIGIGWRFAEEGVPVCVEEWQSTRRRGRSQSELQLSRSERDDLVKQLGYTEREVAAMRRELNRCRANRRQTVNNLSAQRVEETVESVKTKVKSMLFLV